MLTAKEKAQKYLNKARLGHHISYIMLKKLVNDGKVTLEKVEPDLTHEELEKIYLNIIVKKVQRYLNKARSGHRFCFDNLMSHLDDGKVTLEEVEPGLTAEYLHQLDHDIDLKTGRRLLELYRTGQLSTYDDALMEIISSGKVTLEEVEPGLTSAKLKNLRQQPITL